MFPPKEFLIEEPSVLVAPGFFDNFGQYYQKKSAKLLREDEENDQIEHHAEMVAFNAIGAAITPKVLRD